MKKIVLWMLLLMAGSVCRAEDITVKYDGETVKVRIKKKDSVTVAVDGTNVDINSKYRKHKLTLRLTGKSDDGRIMLKSAGKATVKLDGLTLTSKEGAPLVLKNKKEVEVVAMKGKVNTLAITACNDTAKHKASVIWAKDKVLLSGKGILNILATGNGCRGIKTKKDICIGQLTLNVTTTGDNLGEKPFGFGGFPGSPEGGEGAVPMSPFNPDDMPEEMKKQFEEMRKKFEEKIQNGGAPDFGGGIPGFPGFPGFGNDSTREGGFPGFGNDSTGGGGFPGKHKYVASAKGIASKGKITINSGKVTVRTSTAGAEGVEGKEGVVINGGNVDVLTTDDAINANATIEFNGGSVMARSMGNDAVDSNPKGGFFMPFGSNNNQDTEPGIVIRGGTVYAWSQVGSPEEGLDCDFAPFVVEGGTVFSVGGGMGEMPSVPTNTTAKQPTVLLIGINIVKDEPISICEAGSNKRIHTVTIPFSLRSSASLVGCPQFKVGNTYTVKTKGYEKTFTLNEPFTVVR